MRALIIVTNIDAGRAVNVAQRTGNTRFTGCALDASDRAAIVELARAHRVDAIVNACNPRFNPPISGAAYDAECTYLDMAGTLSQPHPATACRRSRSRRASTP